MMAGKSAKWMRSLVVMVGLALLLSIAAVGSALASPRSAQYDNPGKQEPAKVVKSNVVKSNVVKTGVLGAKPTIAKAQSPQATTAGTLPFTGFELVLIVGLGGALVAGGLVLRGAGRKPDETS